MSILPSRINVLRRNAPKRFALRGGCNGLPFLRPFPGRLRRLSAGAACRITLNRAAPVIVTDLGCGIAGPATCYIAAVDRGPRHARAYQDCGNDSQDI